MPSCAFRKCNNNSKNSNKAKGITFHVFPKEPGVKGKWIKIIQEEQRDDEWLPSKYSRVCSVHFNDDMFNLTQTGMRNLKNFALPSFKTPATATQPRLPAPKHAAEPTAPARAARPRCGEPLAPPAAPLHSPVRPRGVALRCEPIKVTSGPSPVIQKRQVKTTHGSNFNPVITRIKSDADPVKQEQGPQSEDSLSLADDTDQLSDADQPSEDLIPLSNTLVPLSNAADPLSDVKIEKSEVEVTRPEGVSRSVEETRPGEVTNVPLPLHLRQELFRAGNDCYNLIRIQGNQVNKLSIRCAKQRQKLRSCLELIRRRNKKISILETEVQALRKLIAEQGGAASSEGGGGGKLAAPSVQIQSSNTAVVKKKANRQLLIIKRDCNRPKSQASARPAPDKQTASVGAKPTSGILRKTLLDALHTSDNRQKSSGGVKRTLNIQEKSSGGLQGTSHVLKKSKVGTTRTSDIRQKSSIAVQDTSSIQKTSLVDLQRTSNIILQKPLSGIPGKSNVLQRSSPVGCTRQKSSTSVKRISDILNSPWIAVQPISVVPQTSAVGFQRTPDIRQNALVIQIDGMHNTVLQPKLVKLDNNSADTG